MINIASLCLQSMLTKATQLEHPITNDSHVQVTEIISILCMLF